MTAKQVIAQVLEQLPDDASMDEILYRLYVRDRVIQGLESARQEGALSHDEAKARLSKWTGA